jgi:dihydrodipicolinate synthase/N-acetylneuraminate lyase
VIERFSGVHWMLATPFDENEGVDSESISRLVAKAQEATAREWLHWG